MLICFPSKAPRAFGKFQRSSNYLAILIHSLFVLGTFRYVQVRFANNNNKRFAIFLHYVRNCRLRYAKLKWQGSKTFTSSQNGQSKCQTFSWTYWFKPTFCPPGRSGAFYRLFCSIPYLTLICITNLYKELF